ncbi:MAG: hypothetical protein ACI4U9_01640 [Clostridia bacterium]
MDANYSLADMRAAMGDTTQDNFLWWVLILFFLAGGNGFWGNRGEATATNADLQRGFDTNTIISKLDGITNGICDSTYALNNSIKEGNYQTQFGINNLGYEMQNCCCQTQRAIDGVNYNNAKNTCDIITNANANTQRIIDTMTTNTIQALRDENLSLRFDQSQCNQNAYLTNVLAPRAIPAYPVCSPYTTFNASCGCGSNSLY